ncbi:MAG: hypothetical protein AB7H71_19025 [Alphaproteobacteria bacterium]
MHRLDPPAARGLAVALVWVALLGSCQPLPHPFANDRPAADLLAVPESAGVSIAPIEGEPKLIATELGGATAAALVRREIPASDKTNLRGSYQLYGDLTASRPQGGQSSVAVRWRLEDARGRRLGEREVRIEGTADEWQSASGAMIDRLAALSADAVAPLLVKTPAAPKLAALAAPKPGPAEPDAAPTEPPPAKPPPPEPAAARPVLPDLAPATQPASPPPAATGTPATPKSGRLRVAVRRVTGAPGDGATSLARAMTGVLRRQDLTLVEPGDKADFTVDGEVSLKPAGPEAQHVKIVWRVHDASGAELGTVGQENDIPRGQLSGKWGDVAFIVATAAGDGLLEVFARTAPAARPARAEAASAARPPPDAGPTRPPGDTDSQPAAAGAKAANTKERR